MSSESRVQQVSGVLVKFNMDRKTREKKILCVGLVCLDIINVVDKYPEEDTDSRCVVLTLSLMYGCTDDVTDGLLYVQVFVAALAARRKRLKLLHCSVPAGGAVRLHGFIVSWTCG